MKKEKVLNIGFVGCGAVAQLYYSQAIIPLLQAESLCISHLIDPSDERLSLLGKLFPNAIQSTELTDFHCNSIDLAIIASPQRFHYQQALQLLGKGVHVLCEKPLATNYAEAANMIMSANDNQRILAVGLFRRFWPIAQYIKDLVVGNDLGQPLSFYWGEGGVFNWPAASPSFFQKASSSGGVLADLGAHVLDLLVYWFGTVATFEYFDDAMGGLENNASLQLHFDNGVAGHLRLSRDTPIPNLVRLEFENCILTFMPGIVGEVNLQFKHSQLTAKALLHPVLSYSQSFAAQLRNVCRAIREEEALRVPAYEALPSMKLIDNCYGSRRLFEQPWLTPAEWDFAQSLVH